MRLALSLLVLVLVAACSPPPDGREFRDFERMRRQQRYSTYDVSHYFANGAVEQPPPAHTVSREASSMTAPVVDDSLLMRGARQFGISCAPCHGTAGFGGGTVAPNLTEARPISLRSTTIASQTPEALFAIVTNGKDRMPPLGWQLDPATRWAVVAYIRALSTTRATSTAAIADSTMADYLHRLDSLHAAHVPVESIATVRHPVEPAR
jgi:mono/diheme cytochrome c family protein